MTKSSSVLKFDTTFDIFTQNRRHLEVGVKVDYKNKVKVSLGHFKFYGLLNENPTSITHQNIKKFLLIPPRVEFTAEEFRIIEEWLPRVSEYSDTDIRTAIGHFNFSAGVHEHFTPIIGFKANEVDWLTNRVPSTVQFTMDEFRLFTDRVSEIIQSVTFHEEMVLEFPNTHYRR
jgi:hypothetical protein